jgi:uncharacterized membrane protein YesL
MFYSSVIAREETIKRASLILQGLVPSAPATMFSVAREHLDGAYDPRHLPVPLEVYEIAQRPFRKSIP